MSSPLVLLKGVPWNDGRQSVTSSGTVQSHMGQVADASLNDAQMVAYLFPESACLPETQNQFVLNVSNTSKPLSHGPLYHILWCFNATWGFIISKLGHVWGKSNTVSVRSVVSDSLRPRGP